MASVATWRPAAETLVHDLRGIFGERLQAVVAYGPHLEGSAESSLSCLALVTSLSASDLDACAGRASHWHRAHLETPLIVPVEEFRRSLDVFPLEFGEIL